ncbi:MAG: hypothetical protein IT258_18630, partial [Saprospiraceae bacterium]|nr:hypothetical protein [Saprospiraceae bacterium]
MKYAILIFIASLVYGCVTNSDSEFTKISCTNTLTPSFDSIIVDLVKDGKAYKDTIVEQIEKKRTVFKPCRAYYYSATFNDAQGAEISKTRVKMMATGKRWEFQPEMQDELVVQYEYEKDCVEKCKPFILNKTLNQPIWAKEEKTGIIENVQQIWMHPFRANQFNFTEVAPYPMVKLPLETGKTWDGQLSIQNGWGDWDNTAGNYSYEVKAKEDILTGYGDLKNCWKIES